MRILSVNPSKVIVFTIVFPLDWAEWKQTPVSVCVCVHMCGGGSRHAHEGRGSPPEDVASNVAQLCFSLVLPLPDIVTLRNKPPALCQETQKGFGMHADPHHAEGGFPGSVRPLVSPTTSCSLLWVFSWLYVLNSSDLCRCSTSAPACLQASGFPFSSFRQGRYHSSIHLPPSKKLLKALRANSLWFSVTLLLWFYKTTIILMRFDRKKRSRHGELY